MSKFSKHALLRLLAAGEAVKRVGVREELLDAIDTTNAMVRTQLTQEAESNESDRMLAAMEILADSAEHDVQPIPAAVLTSRFHEAGLTAEDMNVALGQTRFKRLHIEGVCHLDLRLLRIRTAK